MTHPDANAISRASPRRGRGTGSLARCPDTDGIRLAEIAIGDALNDHLTTVRDDAGRPVVPPRAIAYGIGLSMPIWAVVGLAFYRWS